MAYAVSGAALGQVRSRLEVDASPRGKKCYAPCHKKGAPFHHFGETLAGRCRRKSRPVGRSSGALNARARGSARPRRTGLRGSGVGLGRARWRAQQERGCSSTRGEEGADPVGQPRRPAGKGDFPRAPPASLRETRAWVSASHPEPTSVGDSALGVARSECDELFRFVCRLHEFGSSFVVHRSGGPAVARSLQASVARGRLGAPLPLARAPVLGADSQQLVCNCKGCAAFPQG